MSAALIESNRAPSVSSPLITRAHRALYLLTTAPLALSAFVDVWRGVNFGSVTAMGALTVAQTLLLAHGLIACASYPKRLLRLMLPYLLFLIWAGASTVWATPYINGAQNLTVYVFFASALLLSGTLSGWDRPNVVRSIARGMRWIDYIGLATFLFNFVLEGQPMAEEVWSVGPRSFALVGLIALSWHLAGAYQGQRKSWVLASMWLMAIVLSLSRTASAVGLLYVAIVLLLQLRFRPRSLTMSAPGYGAAFALLGLLALYGTSLQERFLSGDNSIQVGDVQINASGRLNMWPVVLESARESPIVGKGLGSSQAVIQAAISDIGHPHNDYLRIGHDLGLIGLTLLVVALLTWFGSLFAGWRGTLRCDARGSQVQLAGLLALLGLITVMMTDNAIVYPFFMGPLGILVGAGLGHAPMDAVAGRRVAHRRIIPTNAGTSPATT